VQTIDHGVGMNGYSKPFGALLGKTAYEHRSLFRVSRWATGLFMTVGYDE